MKYRNIKTGAIIDVKSKISGGHWQALMPAETAIETSVESTSTGKKKAVKKKCNSMQH